MRLARTSLIGNFDTLADTARDKLRLARTSLIGNFTAEQGLQNVSVAVGAHLSDW